jgi:hypothetical protein
MSRTLEPVAGASRVLFELDRFELGNDDQFQLQGRWFGVRGRRFMRPSLTVTVEGHEVRLLADLADKPWAAEDGQPWKAAFPSRVAPDEVRQAELTVTPDITIELRAPEERTEQPNPREKPEGQAARPRGEEHPPASDTPASWAPKLVEARRRQDQLQRELDRAKGERTNASARMDELLGKLSEAIQERDETRAARDEALARVEELSNHNAEISAQQDSFASERDLAQRTRDEALRARDAALRERDEAQAASQAAAQARDDALAQRAAAVSARGQAESERDGALEARNQANAERDAAQRLRAEAEAERIGALASRDDAIRDRESIRAAIDHRGAEVAHEASSRGAAMVMRRVAQEPAAFRTSAPLLPRALAVIVLMAAVVVLLIVLHVA